MLTKHRFIIVLLSLTAVLAGLVGFSSTDKSLTSSNSTIDKSPADTLNLSNYSNDFFLLENELFNTPIDSELFSQRIIKLNSEFEKDYLATLLNYKLGHYEATFQLLFKHLSLLPDHYNYYDKLVDAARITGSLEPLKENIKVENQDENNFTAYLLALIHFNEGNFSESINQLKKRIDAGFSSKEIYYLLASNYRSTGDYEEGLETLLKAESLCSDNDPFISKIINAQGSFYYLSGFYDKALELYEKAYSKATQTGNVIEEIKASGNLAIIDDLYGDVDAARKKLTAAIERAEKIKSKELLAFLYSELGVSFTYTNNIIEARDNYRKSLKLFSEIKNEERLSYLASNIAALYLMQANYEAALENYEKGLKFAGKNILAQTLNLIGVADVYSYVSNYSKAIDYYNRAKELSDSVKDISSSLKIDQGIGSLYFNVNRPHSALTILKNAEAKLDLELLPFEAAELYHKIGVVLTSIDSLEEAISYLKKGIEFTISTEDIYYQLVLKTELAHTYFKNKNIKDALTLLGEANTLAKKYELIQLQSLQHLYLGKIYQEQSATQKAIVNYSSAYSLSEEVNDVGNQVESGYMLAKLFEELNENVKAEEWYLRITDLIEKTSQPLISNQKIQISHFAGNTDIYNSLINFYLENKNGKKTFETIEKSRSRNTLQNVYNLKVLSKLGSESKIEKYIDTEWMINSNLYSNEIKDSLIMIRNNLALELGKDGADNLLSYPWLTSEEISSGLTDNENLISVFINDNYVEIFLVSSDSLFSNRIDLSRDSLTSLVRSVTPYFRSNINSDEIYTNQDLFSFNSFAAFQLYTTLLKDVVDKVPTDETIIFSFPAELLQLPAEFLVTNWEEGSSPYFYDDNAYLINRNQIMYAPSASIYVNLKERNNSTNSQNLIVGDPAITSEEFSVSYRSGLLEENGLAGRNIQLFPLQYSRYEAESLNSLIPNGVLLLSDDATESNFKHSAEASKIIHLSSHSFLYKDQPLILFSPQSDHEDDGYLEAEEILGLNLNSDLVVLSSCRSGLGKIDEAEGVIGMQKAFFEAGASSIVVSLWDVSDKYTSIFMESFYSYLMQGMSKPEALRNAKLSFIKNHSSNPYYWSPFVLAGNPVKLNLESSGSFQLTFVYLLAAVLLIYFSLRYFFNQRTD